MKRFSLLCAMAVLSAFAFTQLAQAGSDAKTITGKSACATCSGVTEAGHNIMIVDSSGQRWVLIGDSDSYKAAHKVRADEKTMTATLASDAVTKKDATGKDYKEVKVTEVKVEG